jgi:hypothetical protein
MLVPAVGYQLSAVGEKRKTARLQTHAHSFFRIAGIFPGQLPRVLALGRRYNGRSFLDVPF